MVETSAATSRDEMKAADIDSIGQISCIRPGALTRRYGSNIEALVDYKVYAFITESSSHGLR